MIGYDSALDREYDLALQQKWEEENAPRTDGETLRQAAKSMRQAVEDLDKTLDLVNEAAEILVDTPEGDKVASYLKSMEDILSDLRKMQQDFEGGGN